MRKISLLSILPVLALLTVTSCVPQRKYLDQQERANKLEAENNDYKQKLEYTLSEEERLRTLSNDLEKKVFQLREDTSNVGGKYRKTLEMNQNLNDLYEKVIEQNKELYTTTASERQKLSQQLTEKEFQLLQKEKLLNDKEKSINSLQTNLQEREARVKELESLISKKDSAVNALQNSIAKALLSFNENDLTVKVKDGKVYVSLAEQLLFKSGSTTVDPKGKDALVKLAEVLKRQPEIDILIEGHTDNVPMKSATISDNWDLSVLRATSIVRILTGSGVESSRVIPSGRGEFTPVASNETRDGKAKNRRTEIILSPKLDEIFRLIEKR
jgi:chemotaxis protein MotB